jgi:polyhydroxyalkanoate synthesis regulator phasin
MPQSPDWNKYLDAGAEFVAMTRTQARKRAKELVGTGQLAQEQVQGFVDDLVDESRKRTDVLLEIVRKEIQRQVKTLGIATKEDLARLETKLAKSSKSAKATKSGAPKPAKPGSGKGSGKKTAKQSAAKKSGTKQTSTKKAAAKKSAKEAASKAAS